MFITVESSNSKRLGQKRWDFIMIPLRETIVTKLSENGMELGSILDQVQPCSSIGSKVIKKKSAYVNSFQGKTTIFTEFSVKFVAMVTALTLDS